MKGTWRRKSLALILGVLCTLVVLEVLLRAGGAAFLWFQDYRNEKALEDGADFVVLCIGESTTAHGANGDPATGYPALLEEVLNERAGANRFAVINEGVPAADSSVLLARIALELEQYEPHVVVAMMGANDGKSGAIPVNRVPVVARTGFPYWFKTYQLAALLHHQLTRNVALEPAFVGGSQAAAPSLDDPVRARLNVLGTPLALMEEATQIYNAACPPGTDGPAACVPPEDLPLLEAAEEGARSAVERQPRVAELRHRLARVLFLSGKPHQAEQACRNALSLRPDDDIIRGALAVYLWSQGRYSDAEREARKARDAVVLNSGLDYVLAESLVALGRRDEAHRLLLGSAPQAKGPGPSEDLFVTWPRALFLARHGSKSELDDYLEAELRRSPFSASVLYGRLARYFDLLGDEERRDAFLSLSDAVRRGGSEALTRDNYNHLARLLRSKHIPLIAVQYPGRPLRTLEALFEDSTGVFFVDNEADFKEALRTMAYGELFGDHCYGDFGHATRKGNRILAENIAEVIAGLPGARRILQPGGPTP